MRAIDQIIEDTKDELCKYSGYSDRIEITQDEVSEIQVDDYHREKKPCKEKSDCSEFLKFIYCFAFRFAPHSHQKMDLLVTYFCVFFFGNAFQRNSINGIGVDSCVLLHF